MISIIIIMWYKRFRLVMEKNIIFSVGMLGKIVIIVYMVEVFII